VFPMSSGSVPESACRRSTSHSLFPHHSTMLGWFRNRFTFTAASLARFLRKAGWSGYSAARVHEILPDHEAEPVAQIIERIVLVIPPPQTLIMFIDAVAREREEPFVGSGGSLWQK